MSDLDEPKIDYSKPFKELSHEMQEGIIIKFNICRIK